MIETRQAKPDGTLPQPGLRRFGWIPAAALLFGLWVAPAAQASSLDMALQTPPGGQGAQDLTRVTERLGVHLTSELRQNFGLFVYVDKAASGPFAQRMYVFRRTDLGDLALLYNWPVSTGRESLEQDPHGRLQSSITPTGFFELDPARLYADHTSSQWNEPMPFAMFFNWQPGGHKTGLAIHGTADSDVGQLGTRASAGCVRLATDNAHTLFDLVSTTFRVAAPALAYRDSSGPVSSDGLLVHAEDGSLPKADGYSVLVLIDDYTGDERTSALY
ncbi:MAG TPA: L,D-transpeptidase [Rhizomicrobium sp.]